jgi:hypothetical protein
MNDLINDLMCAQERRKRRHSGARHGPNTEAAQEQPDHNQSDVGNAEQNAN